MKLTWLSLLAVLGLLVNLGVAKYQVMPGYMDADYYFATALRLRDGYRWTEDFLWNYLNAPKGIPNPSFMYWMPLASLLGAFGMMISGLKTFAGARLGFLIISASIPPITALLAYLLSQKKKAAFLAGALALFPGFYLPNLPITETFGIYMLLGGIFFLIAALMDKSWYTNAIHARRVSNYLVPSFALGLIVGMMHLARADGVLWLFIAFGWIAYLHLRKSPRDKSQEQHPGVFKKPQLWAAWFICLLGYWLVMYPWFSRNYMNFGRLFPPGISRTLWLVDYDDLFIYPASLLTPDRWWMSGVKHLLAARIWSLIQNLKTTIAVQGGVVLLPLMVLGIWNKRDNALVRLGIVGWIGVWMVMTIIYPYQGARGGFFHSGAALQPLLWALIPIGLDMFVEWGKKRRGWEFQRAWRAFAVMTFALTVGITVYITWRGVIQPDKNIPKWNMPYRVYQMVDLELSHQVASNEAIVMVNNPPAYSLISGKPAIVIPDGDLDMTLSVAKYYSAEYLLLDNNYPTGLEKLYLEPGHYPGLRYLGTIDNVRIYQFDELQ